MDQRTADKAMKAAIAGMLLSGSVPELADATPSDESRWMRAAERLADRLLRESGWVGDSAFPGETRTAVDGCR